MTIKEVEERTGLTRSNIRFYEKEKLIEPSRNDIVNIGLHFILKNVRPYAAPCSEA